ncbi:uncharacterized protein EDB91DRAFT_1187487 [Suillus paluster]|uniref:uncharacterized protein n=1 Tax=Suillus paluster TaxID=48578 RepID=UPI001B86406A|nr:uncharacterized protein EDB91DRAFT_1187487 [Suillus paluster]KAG1717979.1 hypothetical protein EDB91DRAFT_1187487 [Suillus paluster]
MRQSVAPSRISHAASLASQANNASAISRLQEKKKEFEAVAALERASALFLKRIEGLADDCEVMADAGQVHGQVLEQWPLMFQTLSLFLNSREQHPADSSDDTTPLTGERLVRIPVDELQTDVSKQSDIGTRLFPSAMTSV